MKEKIRDFIEQQSGERVGDDDELFEADILDSMSIIQLILFLSKEFGVDTSDPDFEIDELNSINNIVNYIKD